MIDKNVPMPQDAPRGASPKYTEFREMQVGDSCFYAEQTTAGRAATAARVYGGRSGKKFRAVTMDGGVRIWRIA